MQNRRTLAYVALAAVAVTGCTPDYGYTTLTPQLSVLPGSVDFGEVVAGEATAVARVFVDNGGRADLIGDIRIDGTNAGLFTFDADPAIELDAGRGFEFDVTFAPVDVEPAEAGLVFETNDPDAPTVIVLLEGVGRVPYAPDIEVAPGSLDFGDVDPGDDATLPLQLRNVGDAVLHLGTLTQSGAGAFVLRNDDSGQQIGPGETRTLLVTYSSITGDGDTGSLAIASDDADEPVVQVALSGNGGGQGEYPEAVIDCPGTVDLRGPVQVPLDGSASTDPNGLLPLAYAWTIVRRPDAADQAGTPTPADGPLTEVRIDAAGVWEVQLRVTNALGVPSAPTKCVIDAVPVDQLHVELFWSGASSDLDLHLAEGDAAFYSVPGDVSWCNRAPDWGARGAAADNPSLDLDDDDGYGPENINVAEPADGTYPVRVHLFDDGDDGEVTATVSVFALGQLVHSSSKVLRRNQVWDVGQVNWPEATFGVSNARPWDAEGERGCE